MAVDEHGDVGETARAMSETQTSIKATPDPRDERADALAQEAGAEREAPGKWPARRSVRISVLVPVKNEERNVVECLRRLQWADQIVVVDSQSKDRTIPLSQAMGAEVYQFHYSKAGWPKKKNWALENVPWRNEWVLILDADEHMTPELAEEIVQVVEGRWQGSDERERGCGDGYWLNRRFMFMGKWIRGCGYYPSWNVRFFKHAVGRYERIGDLGDTGSGDNEVHEHVVLSTGEAGYLRNEFLHFAYPDLTTWIEKHNRYTTWEAHAMEAGDAGAVRPSLFGGPIERRRWLKRYARRLPFRPTLRFLYSYIIEKGFLDGYPGFVMCRLLAWYEFVSLAKHHEMTKAEPHNTAPAPTARAAKAPAPGKPSREPSPPAPPRPREFAQPAPLPPSAARTPHTGKRANIEVLIPTFNEEINLPHALRSVVGWVDAVHVLDSESTDRTREIAKEAGAHVVVQKWLGYARQKNWGLDNIPFNSDWVFILDADETITPELRDELLELAARQPESIRESGFYVNRLTYFMNKPIRHCGYFPSYNLRFFKRGRARYEDREVHEHMVVDGPTGRLKRLMTHEDRRGLEHFIAKHNRYSTLEARQTLKDMRGKASEAVVLERGVAVRRWLKRHVQPRLPFAAMWRFLYMYVWKLGVLDGATGLRFCLFISTYDFFISLKKLELEHSKVAAPERLTTPPARGLAIPEGELASAPAPSAKEAANA